MKSVWRILNSESFTQLATYLLFRLTMMGILAGCTGRSPAAGQAPDISVGPMFSGQMTLTWGAVSGRVYELQHVNRLGAPWTTLSSAGLPLIATSTPLTAAVAATATAEFFQVKENPSPFDPAWAARPPVRTLSFNYNSALSTDVNGANLKAAIQALVPGDRLEIGSGTYSINSFTTFNLQGSSNAPIWIATAPGASVIITRPDANQNLINLGSGAPTRYLSIVGMEFVGGSQGIRLYDCANVRIDSCKVHETGDVGISANAANTSQLYLTRNEIWDTGLAGSTGEGMYLGASNGLYTMSDSIIALNHIHNTGGTTGSMAGIQVKTGSWGNLIAANRVHDDNGPCIILYGAGGLAPNIVEKNTCYGTPDNAIQVTADCIIRDNLVSSGSSGNSAFAGTVNSGTPTNVTVVNNTFVNGGGPAVRLYSWEMGTNMVFANNACYSQTGVAVLSATNPVGVVFAGNVNYGALATGVTGFQAGTGLADFVNASWDDSQLNVRPGTGSALRGAASAAYVTQSDLNYSVRAAPYAAGCYEN